MQTESAMQSTVDWTDKVSTTFQVESNSSEDMITAVLQRPSGISKSAYAVLVLSVLGILTNSAVLFGFWLAGRSKMNVSSAYIVNHTTLEQQTFNSNFKTAVFDRKTPVRSLQTYDEARKDLASTC